MYIIKKYYKFINEEIDFNIKPVNFVKGLMHHNGIPINTYTFITNRNNSYTVYIHNMTETNHVLNNGENLYNLNGGNNPIPTFYFSETNRGVDVNTFNILSGKREFMEVMGKVTYIINEFIKNNKQYNVFSIGEVEEDKFKFYHKWFKHFNDVYMLIGISDNYLDLNNNKMNAYYLIRK